MLDGKFFDKIICCPDCKKNLRKEANKYCCDSCNSDYPVIDKIPVLIKNDKQKNEIIEKFYKTDEYEDYRLKPTRKVADLLSKHSLGKRAVLDIGCGTGEYVPYLTSEKKIWHC